MAYEKWFIRRHDILEEEIKAFRDAGFNFRIDECKRDEHQIIVFVGSVEVAGQLRNLELVYPAEFPQFPILVYCDDVNLSRHQHPLSKNLCVIPHNQDGWDSDMTGAYMVRQAIRLLSDTETGPEAVADNEVDAPEPWSNYLEYRMQPLFIAGHLPTNIPSQCGEFDIALYPGKYNFHPDKSYAELGQYCALEGLRSKNWSHQFDRPFVFQEARSAQRFSSFWFALDTTPCCDMHDHSALLKHIENTIPDAGSFTYRIRQHVKNYRNAKPKQRTSMGAPNLAIIFPEEDFERGRYRKTFLWGTYQPDPERIDWSQPQFFSIDEHFRRIPDLAPIYYESALVVGIGSLGSAVALELGKCGIGSLTLVDCDGLDAGNLCRHTGSLPYIGMHKTKILAEQVRSHFPFCNAESLPCGLGRVDRSTNSDGSFGALYNKMKESSLVIDTAVDARITRVLNRFAVELGKPIIHAWVTNGAWGGRVIRYVPGKTGCYHCFANSNIPNIASADIEEIYPGGCGFPTFAGTSYDIYEVAAHTVRMACSTLLEKPDVADHVLIEHYPAAVKTFPILRNPDCPLCGGSA